MRSLIRQIHIPPAWDNTRRVENVLEHQIHPLEFPQNVSIRSEGRSLVSGSIFRENIYKCFKAGAGPLSCQRVCVVGSLINGSRTTRTRTREQGTSPACLLRKHNESRSLWTVHRPTLSFWEPRRSLRIYRPLWGDLLSESTERPVSPK